MVENVEMKFYQHKRQKAAVAIFCSLLASPAFALVNLVSGGTFSPRTGWEGGWGDTWDGPGTNTFAMAGTPIASPGDYTLRQTVSGLTVGAVYELNFKAHNWSSSSLKYSLFGVDSTVTVPSFTVLSPRTFTNLIGPVLYTATSSSTILRFTSLGSADSAVSIDDVTLYYYGPGGPSSADTQSSLTTLSKSLRSSFNATVMSSNYANMNTYDCNLFDKNNMCISAGGRITTIDNPSSHHSAAVVVLGHKISPHIRIGGFLDQSVNHNMPSGVDMSNKNPMAGAFLVWNHQADGLGLQMKLANAYLDKDVTTSRAVVGTSEAGRGRTDLNTQSYVSELSYAFNYQDSTIVRPYFALRYTRIKQDGYTEDTTAAVTSPLTYAKLSDRSTSALMGVKVNHALTPKTNLTASLGVEQDLDHKSDQLIATGVSGLTSENFNNNIRHTRPVASLGAYYAVAKNQRLSGDIYYQQLPFQSTDSATAYVNYMIGF
jgi:hypothetical protein